VSLNEIRVEPMLCIVLSALVGACAAFFILWPYGALVACFGAPFGGGIFAALAALWLGLQSDSKRIAPTVSGDKMSERRAPPVKANSPPE
jgi:hypothetical protein